MTENDVSAHWPSRSTLNNIKITSHNRAESSPPAGRPPDLPPARRKPRPWPKKFTHRRIIIHTWRWARCG